MSEHGADQYLVFMDPDPALAIGAERCVALGNGLYICNSPLNRSRLYHTLKAAHHPARLLVAPLAGQPKFKGMAQGALKILREQTRKSDRTAPASTPRSGN